MQRPASRTPRFPAIRVDMAETPIILRLTIADPVPGVRYSLQGKDNTPVDAVTAADTPLSFDVPARLADDGRLLGPFVRRQGPPRRFVYIAVGKQAGDASSCWDRRAKIDVHDCPAELLAEARRGRVLETVLPGRLADGSPICAMVQSSSGWRVI